MYFENIENQPKKITGISRFICYSRYFIKNTFKMCFEDKNILFNVIALDKKLGYYSKDIGSKDPSLDFSYNKYSLLCFTNKTGVIYWDKIYDFVELLVKENEGQGLIFYKRFGDILLFPKANNLNLRWVKSIVEEKWGQEGLEVFCNR